MDLIKYIAFLFIFSYLVMMFIKLLCKNNKLLITDYLHNGPQKLHKNSTPRIGGFGIFLGVFVFVVISFIYRESFRKELLLIFLCSLPVFVTGTWEDLRANLKPRLRLLLTSVSGMLVFLFLGGVSEVDLPLLDDILHFAIFSFIFTVFAITGMVHASNIIDGTNGLASFISIMNLFGLTIIACRVGDITLAIYGFVFISIIMGFFVFNWPSGSIFLGDGGAYLIGYLIAVMSILLLRNHPEVSPWAVLLINIYPVFETVFSIFRRKLAKKASSFFADASHLHTLLYNTLARKFPNYKDLILLSSFTSVLLWFFNIFAVVPGVIFKEKSLLILFLFIFLLLYSLIYRELLNFKRRYQPVT
ncbi:MAG TPA: MraY family glycosyltransferase [bacterium]|nr:MraY family glycosyltransferase [bacterium]